MRRYVLYSTLAAMLLLAAARQVRASGITFVLPRVGIASGQGFCANGAFFRTSWQAPPPTGIRTWGFYCRDGDSGQGAIVTSPFVASHHLWLYLAGYTSNPGLSLWIERISDHSKFLIQPSAEPREEWLLSEFVLPASWQGSLVRLIATDHNTGAGGWLSFSEPVKVHERGINTAVILAAGTIFHFILLLLPALAVCAWILHRGVRNTVTARLVLLTSVGTAGYLVFWCYFIHPRLGYVVGLILPIVAAIYLISLARNFNSSARQVFTSLLAPVALVGAAALLVLSMGFLYGGMQDPFRTASVRFSHQLPIDNALPYLLAKGLRQGRVPKPLALDWRASDRPPLQSGLVLSQEPFGHPREVGYTVVSVIAQSFWIFGLWLLLTACGVKPHLIALVLFTCLFSGFVFLNSFFVVPKLLAAAFTLAFFAVVFGDNSGLQPLETKIRCVAAGVLLSLGMLSHGGTIFAIIGAGLAFVVLRRRLPLASIALMAGVAAGVYLPWLVFQKFVDPPGNRLLKMHLAGVEPIDNRSFGETLVSAYRGLTLHQVVDHKLANVERSVGMVWESDFWGGMDRIARDILRGDYAEAVKLAPDRRLAMFYSFVVCLGFLPCATVALAAGVKQRFRTLEWRTAATLFLLVAFSLLGWWILMFGPGTTIIVSGAYAVNLLAMTACILVLWSVSPWLAAALSALQVSLNVLLYVVLMRGFVPGGPLPEGHLHGDVLVLCMLALAGVVYCLIRIATGTRAESPYAAGRVSQQSIASPA